MFCIFPCFFFFFFLFFSLVSRFSSAADGGGVHKKENNGINSIPGVRTACVASSSRAAAYPSILQASKSSLKRKHAFGIAGEPGKFSKAAASIDVRKVVKFSNNVHTFPSVLGRNRSIIGELQLKRPIKKSKPVQSKSRLDSIKKEFLTPSQQRSISVTSPADRGNAINNIIDVEPVLKTTTTKTKFRQRKKGGSIVEKKAAETDQAASPPPRRKQKLRIKSGSLVRQPLALAASYCRAPPRLAYSIQPNRATRLLVIRDTDRKGIGNRLAAEKKKHHSESKYKHNG